MSPGVVKFLSGDARNRKQWKRALECQTEEIFYLKN